MTDDVDAALEVIENQISKNFWDYSPYPKQKEFHNYSSSKRERALSAGNQVGKTTCAAYETAFHATGIYPEWWEGRKFKKKTTGWIAGVTGESTRDVIQKKLFGDINTFEGGVLHKDYIVDYSRSRGMPDAIDTVWVKHTTGLTSIIQLKSYEKGREKWQGTSLDYVWFDEEPPLNIYMEGLSRTNATDGIVYTTFTPLMGMSNVVLRFWKENHQDCQLVLMGLKEAQHISEEKRERIVASYPEHERKARTEGVPMLGSGRIFPLPRERISAVVPEIPAWWPRICGLDIGWDHPTAAVWCAWDRDTDTMWVYDCYREREQSVLVHSAVMRTKGDWIPVAWPHDALAHDKGSGEQISSQYRENGINMLPHRATFKDGSNGVEAGISEMLDRMKTGRFKVAPHLEEWFEEFELYHRDNGKIVKERDDLISATRYAMMMLRYAQTEHEREDPEEDYDHYLEEDKSTVAGY